MQHAYSCISEKCTNRVLPFAPMRYENKAGNPKRDFRKHVLRAASRSKTSCSRETYSREIKYGKLE